MAAGLYHASYLHGEVAEDPDAEGGVAEVAFPAQRALLEPAHVRASAGHKVARASASSSQHPRRSCDPEGMSGQLIMT